MDASVYISLGSFVVAAIALQQAMKKDRQKTTNNKKAVIRAKGYKRGSDWRVKIWNDGAGIARNINFHSEDLVNDDGIKVFFKDGQLPYPLLNSDESFELSALLTYDRKPLHKITLTWDDDFKKGRAREQVLEFD